jgi:pimeloyl-ACP methyl ester carboxylesterase
MKMKYTILLLCTCFLFVSNGKAQKPYEGMDKVSSFEELEYPFEMKKQALSNAITMAYADMGSGDTTLILIHGLGSYAPAWKNNIPELSKHYRCIAVDLPGYGKSSKYEYSGSMGFFADAVKELADSLGIAGAVMVGHSMGGQISTVMALKYPYFVQKLVLIAPAGIETFSEGEKEWFRTAITPKGVMLTPLQTIETNLSTNFYKMPKDAYFMSRDRYAMTGAGDEFKWYCYVVSKSVQGMVDQPVYRNLPQITQPTLIMIGASDRLIPNRYLHGGSPRSVAEKGAELIPNSKAVVIKKAGHFVMFEQSQRVSNEILTFVKSQ